MKSVKHYMLVLILFIFLFTSSIIYPQQYMMRYPDVSDDKIVFSCNNDLWIVSLNGGIASRIIKNIGHEIFPKFSPNGSQIVFTADYYVTKSIYLTDTIGADLKRLTYHPADDIVLDWLDDKNVLFRTNREYPFHTHEIYKINIEKEIPEKIPFDNVGLVGISPNLKLFAYTRLAAEHQEYHERKRYTGSQSQDIWIGDKNGIEFKQITKYIGTDNFPMWKGKFIYFTSDRNNGTLNIYKYDLNNEEITQLTSYDDFDVKYPSLGSNHIIYQHAESLRLFNLKTETSERVNIIIPKDSIYIRSNNINATNYTGTFGLSPNGENAVFDIRGEIINCQFSANDSIINLTKTSNSREKNPVWSPDGKWIAFISDRSGEEELYLKTPNSDKLWRQITKGGFGFRMNPIFSPDGKYLIFHDKFMKLNLVEIELGNITVIDQGEYDDSWFRWGIQDYCWSNDSKWIAYTKMEESMYESIFLYSLPNNKSYRVTSSQFNDFSPSFSKDGKYLYFLSQRKFDPIMGHVDQDHIFINMTLPYALILKEGNMSPFSNQRSNNKPADNSIISITTSNFEKRIVEIPISSGNLFRLESIENGFLYLKKTRNEFYKYQNITDGNRNTNYDLYKYDIEKKENKLLMKNISQYHISNNCEKLIYKANRNFGVIDIGKADIGNGLIDLNKIGINIDRKQEYMQIFNEAWRLQRDWFYDKNMHGLNWVKTGEKYRRLVQYCTTREDLNYVISEMMAELNCSHTYVGGGEIESSNYIGTGLLGIDFMYDEKAGYPKILKIIPTDNWNREIYSPFYEPGCPVRNGDYILAIDSIKIELGVNIFKYLQNKRGKIISITYNNIPDLKGAQNYKFQTLYSENDLRYNEWVNNNINNIEQKSNSKVGYIHLPYLERTGLGIFAKYFYPQYYKRGLIIDVRYNRGGFASFIVLNRLRRELNSYKQPREGKSYSVPERVFNGKLVLIINRYSGSAAEIFTEAWKNYNLGPIIGETTWGGATGTEGHQSIIDGGRVSAPQFPRFNLKGEWIIESNGVEPDIEVINMPDDILNGYDAQLEKAIDVILERIKNEPKIDIKRQDYPNKSKNVLR